jgi:outer membrane protein assembly factor BamD
MRSLAVIAAFIVASLVAGCGLLPDAKDETVGWSAEQTLCRSQGRSQGEGSYDQGNQVLRKARSRAIPMAACPAGADRDRLCLLEGSEPGSAIAACDRFIKLHPNHPNVDYVYYLRGLINFNEDLGLMGIISNAGHDRTRPEGSARIVRRVQGTGDPLPEQQVHARMHVLRMKYLVNALASLEVHVARYYMKRGAYLAAANRAQYAVKNYPNAPATEEALFIMVKAYDAMGMNDLRDDAERVMRKNYPEQSILPAWTRSQGTVVEALVST